MSDNLSIHINSNDPLLLFPLRLETHFKRHQEGLLQLCIRIYPDDIMLSEVKTKDAFGNVFTKKVADHLPERFVAVIEYQDAGRSGSTVQTLRKSGRTVTCPLAVGIFPDGEGKYGFNPETSDLEIKEGVAWMTDYDLAVQKGMAITFDLYNVKEVLVKSVFVYGLYPDSGHTTLINNLFRDHVNSKRGLSLAPVGLPTNQVEGASPIKLTGKTVDRTYNDITRLNRFLGLDTRSFRSYFRSGERSSVRLHMSFNKRMWKIMYGRIRPKKGLDYMRTYYELSRLMLNEDGHVSGIGLTPMFKLGNRIYGVMPTTDTDSLDVPGFDELIGYLGEVRAVFEKVADEQVLTASRLNSIGPGKDVGGHYLSDMAALTPRSVSAIRRPLVSSQLLPPRDIADRILPHEDSLARKLDSFPNWKIILKDLFLHPVDDAYIRNADIVGFLLSEQEKASLKEEFVLTDEGLVYLLHNFIDLFTHRIDAWYEALIDFSREQRKLHAPFLGAYGWVFDLKEHKRTPLPSAKAASIAAGMKVQADSIFKNDEAGNEFILAPSQQHALTAAILRSGYLKTRNSKSDSTLCVNLSSRRVRQALRLIEGLKRGMSTGVILGADLESYLHESGLDRLIYKLRQLFPQYVDLQAQTSEANDYVMQVINAESLISSFMNGENADGNLYWNNNGSVLTFLENNYDKAANCLWIKAIIDECSLGKAELPIFFHCIAKVVDTYDALSDILLAEGVQRIVTGDQASYAAILSFMEKGSGSLPGMSILETPMEKVAVSQRAGIAIPDAASDPEKDHVLTVAEPGVARWLEHEYKELGRPTVRFRRTAARDGAVTIEDLPLQDLDVSLADYLYLSSNGDILKTYLEARYRLLTGDFEAEVSVIDDWNDSQDNVLTLVEDEAHIGNLRHLFQQARSMRLSDFADTSASERDEDEHAIDKEELVGRVKAVRSALESLRQKMEKYLSAVKEEYSDEDMVSMVRLLCSCEEACIGGALPVFDRKIFTAAVDPLRDIGLYDECLQARTRFVLHFEGIYKTLADRLQEEKDLRSTCKDDLSSHSIDSLHKLLGSHVRILPRFGLDFVASRPESCGHLLDMLTKGLGDNYSNVDRLGLDEWLCDVAEVRDGMRCFHQVDMFDSAMKETVRNAAIVQFHVKENGESGYDLGQWLGTTVSDESILHDADSLVVYDKDLFSPGTAQDLKNQVFKGIVFDSWLEYIPYKKSQAGLAFHFDQPDNEAPQAMLYCMHPKRSGTWTEDLLLKIFHSTYQTLMNRLVDPDLVYKDEELSTLFPLIFK